MATNRELAGRLRGVVVEMIDDHARVKTNLTFTDRYEAALNLATAVDKIVGAVVTLEIQGDLA